MIPIEGLHWYGKPNCVVCVILSALDSSTLLPSSVQLSMLLSLCSGGTPQQPAHLQVITMLSLIHLHQHPWCKYIPPPGGEGREEEEVVGQERERIAGLNKIFHLCICTKLAFQDICFLSFSPAVMIRSKTDNNQATNNPLQRKPNAKICVLCKIIYMVAQQHTRFIHFLPLSLGGRLNQSSEGVFLDFIVSPLF